MVHGTDAILYIRFDELEWSISSMVSLLNILIMVWSVSTMCFLPVCDILETTREVVMKLCFVWFHFKDIGQFKRRPRLSPLEFCRSDVLILFTSDVAGFENSFTGFISRKRFIFIFWGLFYFQVVAEKQPIHRSDFKSIFWI